MDGTLVDSAAGVAGAWEEFSKTYPGIDVDKILSSEHLALCLLRWFILLFKLHTACGQSRTSESTVV
jgi:beta-phosphoglucomutase-like phosphatase (HAD superfamily)